MIPGDEKRNERNTRKETFFSAGVAGVALPVGLAMVFLAFHLPYLPASLEDLDSINFALGIRRFDVAHHQPHPPGYPVFMLLAKALHAVVPAEVTGLALMSVIAGALGVVGLGAVYRRLDDRHAPASWSAAAIAVAITSPLYWFTAVRPLSDASGLAAALAVQAMTLAATGAGGLAAAGFGAGLAAGIRSQAVWLTVPLVIVKALGARHSGLEGLGRERPAPSSQLLAPAVSFAAGVLVWFIPLIIVSGGAIPYWRALFDQGAEDLGNIQMLWSHHGARDVADALYYAFVAPWAAWPVAAVALPFVVLGVWRLFRHRRRALTLLAAAFGPYLVFDLLFQETFTSRYALPLVVPMAYLAVNGLRALPWDTGLAVAVAMAMFGAHAGGTSIAAYSRAAAPAFRLLDDMRGAAASASAPPVLAMDRRESLDMRRPMTWAGDAMPAIARTLPSPPQHEWLEAVKYWNGGGGAPVWFVVDPRRTAIDLVQHGPPIAYRWTLPYPVLLDGVRPNDMNWYRVDRPDWYVGEGWSLTPEAAGVAMADGRDLSRGPIAGWISRTTSGGTLMIGGRSFDPTIRPRLTVTLDRRGLIEDTVMPGTFLRFVPLPLAQYDPTAGHYAAVTVETTPGAGVAIEQFDASSTRSLFGFGDGWHEQEFNPRTGRRWRWLSERGELKIAAPPRPIPPGAIRPYAIGQLTLHLEGESPRTYFSRASRLTVRSSDRVLLEASLASDFSLDIPIPNAAESIVLETDQVFSPADRSWRGSADRRHLGLRISQLEVRRQK